MLPNALTTILWKRKIWPSFHLTLLKVDILLKFPYFHSNSKSLIGLIHLLKSKGVARGIVIRVGDNTVMGRIASLTSGVEPGPTPMAREIQAFIRLVSVIAISTGSIIFTVAMV